MIAAPDAAELGNACSGFSAADLTELAGIAAQYRTAGGQFMRLVAGAGRAAQAVVDRFPGALSAGIDAAASWAMQRAYGLARTSQGSPTDTGWWNRRLRRLRGERGHRAGAMLSGGIGGFFGVPGTLADLPVTTTLILRSLQQIAEEHGFDPADPAVRIDCLTVFGMGGPSMGDDQIDSGLWAVRVGMARLLTPELIASVAASEAFRLIVQRFGIVVSQKLLAQAAPVVGAAAGATINPLFTRYYQTMAHVHFRLRKLERAHDPDQVRACFERVLRSQQGAKP